MTEKTIQSTILISDSQNGKTMFRNNVGLGWTGTLIKKLPDRVILGNPRPVKFGLCPGSSDLIGMTPVVITPEMVGHTIAVFTGEEVKTPKGRPTDKQINFIDRVNHIGGIAGIVRSPADSLALTDGFLRRFKR